MTWTQERIQTLVNLWLNGKSASAIAEELGNITRNAVIGKIHRLGVSQRENMRDASSTLNIDVKPSEPVKKTRTPRKKSAAPSGEAAKIYTRPEVKRKVARVATAQPKAIPTESRKPQPQTAPRKEVLKEERIAEENKIVPNVKYGIFSVLDLNERSCKWPYGDPGEKDFHFCGKPAYGSSPYCEEHMALAYSVPPRKNDPRGQGRPINGRKK